YLFIAMFGLVLGILARSCIEGLLKHVEEKNGSYFGRQFVMRVQQGFVTLTVKFLNFFISRCLQFRYSPAVFPAPSIMSLSFWVAFTRSISSMPDNPLQ
ncbi:hypothetical protein ERO13_D06G030950v2, partial [Gossypium hirsutum]